MKYRKFVHLSKLLSIQSSGAPRTLQGLSEIFNIRKQAHFLQQHLYHARHKYGSDEYEQNLLLQILSDTSH